MALYEKKEEYLEMLRDQIRCKKARSLVAEELDQHIEDQKAAYILEGDDEDDAMSKALTQMGDPISVGKQLNKVHRPRMGWHILLIVILLSVLGVLAQLSLRNLTYGNISKHLMFLAAGFTLMLILYFIDYSFIGRYPKLIWLLLVGIMLLYIPFGKVVNGQYLYLHAYGQLFIPAFGGIIYAYRNKGYTGIIKCLSICIITCMIESNYISQVSVYLGLMLSCLVMLSVAAMKDWFGITKRKAIAMIWGWIPIAGLLILITDVTLLNTYQFARLKSTIDMMISPQLYPRGYQMNTARAVISNAKLLGGSTDNIIGYLPGVNNDYILTYVIGKWGIAAGVLLIVLFLVLIGSMIYISLRQKHNLGRFVGLGCSLVFAVQGGIYILANLGIQLVSQVNLPFVSYGGSALLINFLVFGIMLSIFRNTNIIKEVPYKLKRGIKIEIVKQA